MSNRLFNGMSHNHLGTNAGPEGVVVARVRHSHGRGKGAAIVRSRGSIIWETVVTVGVYLPSGSGLHSILVNREHHLRCQWLSPVVSTLVAEHWLLRRTRVEGNPEVWKGGTILPAVALGRDNTGAGQQETGDQWKHQELQHQGRVKETMHSFLGT